MAKLIYGLNVSLDGYVDHQSMGPGGPGLFQHFIEQVRGQTGMIYGRTMYEVMRYWDDEQADWGAAEREYAAAWRSKPKWVVSRSMKSVGPNATLIADDAEAAIRQLKVEQSGEIGLAGTRLAASMAGLIDVYQLYLRPVVVGGGTPYFAGPRPPLRLLAGEVIVENVMRLSYVPA